ncbi:hypothetical protein TNCV_1936121 [Trichonephila clavipes]|nr:hypothetical protein TNCV_1936121 [Trichonephila clavipes]
MKGAIWATYFHKASTDAYPQHGLCPTNEDTWCEYNRAITTGEVYKRKNTLPSEVLNCIKNVYRELSTPFTSLPNAYMPRIPLRRQRIPYQQLTEFERGRVIGLLKGEFPLRDIADRLSQNLSTVADCCEQWSKYVGMLLPQEDRVPGLRDHQICL